MKIHFTIAQGWKRGELKKWFEDNPDTVVDPEAKLSAVRSWVSDRFGRWFSNMKIIEYSVYDVTTEYFRVDFLHDTDAQAFLKQIGGTVIEE